MRVPEAGRCGKITGPFRKKCAAHLPRQHNPAQSSPNNLSYTHDFSHHALGEHGVGNLTEAGNIGALDVVYKIMMQNGFKIAGRAVRTWMHA